MMMANRNHKNFKMSSRSHTMPPRRQKENVREAEEKEKYPSSLRAEVVTEDETLQKLFAFEIKKAQVVTHQGYAAVFACFIQSQVVTDAVKKREDEKKRNANKRQIKKSANPFRAAGNMRKSAISRRLIAPYNAESADKDQEVNLALRRSVILSEEEEEQLNLYNNEHDKKAEKQRLVDSFLVSYHSKEEGIDCQVPSPQDPIGIKSRKKLDVTEIIVTDCEFKRTSSSSSLRLRDVFGEELDSDDDTLSTGSSCTLSVDSEYSNSSAPCHEFRKIKETNAWLPWPKKNDGETLLVSFPSTADNSFLAWPQEDASNNPDASYERHYV